jgi:hypothetical protein
MTITRPALLLALLASIAACGRKPAPSAESSAVAIQALASIVATCGAANGDVQVRRAGQATWEPIATGAAFRAGDEVRTGALAYTRVEFLAGGGLELNENASVLIDVAPPAQGAARAADAPPEARVAVTGGEVRAFLPEGGGGGAAPGLVIKSSDGTETRLAAAPGGKPVAFRVSNGAKGTELSMTTGAAVLTSGGAETSLQTGQAVGVGAGAVTAPIELIDFPPSLEPGVDARFHFKPGMTVRMSWRAVPEAKGYRIQLGRDLAFQTVVASSETQGTEFTFAPRGPGMHAWRVAAQDREGRYGEWGFARRFYTEKEPPRDLLIGPEDGAALRFTDEAPPITFSWQSAGSADSYRLVLANGPDLLAQKVLTTVAGGQRVQLEGLAPGEYHWGVYVDDEATPEPIFVKSRRLSLQRVEKPKVTVPKAISDWGK